MGCDRQEAFPLMAKKKTESQLKSEINQSQAKLSERVDQLMGLYEQLSQLRSRSKKPPFDESHAAKQLDRITEKSAEHPEAVRAVLRELVGNARIAAKATRVAFLGPEHSFSHLAAIEKFGKAAELVPVGSIATVFDEVKSERVRFGIVPIENSTDGRITDTLGMFAKMPLRICGELQLRIHHNLLGKGARSQIREVQSKPQALSQCRGWLAKNLPSASLVAASSTTTAAEAASKKKGVAAIASRQAAVNYGIEVLAKNIEDNPDNVTRFAVIGLEKSTRTGADKTSMMFELAHEPGALSDALTIFKRNRLNMTWIESFPKRGSKNEYLFFTEVEGFETDMKVRRALAALEKKVVRIDILGSYAKTEPVG